jgi:hypothetical protein
MTGAVGVAAAVSSVVETLIWWKKGMSLGAEDCLTVDQKAEAVMVKGRIVFAMSIGDCARTRCARSRSIRFKDEVDPLILVLKEMGAKASADAERKRNVMQV